MAVSQASYDKIQALLMKNTPVDIYKMVLSGELQRFPNGFWGMPENYKYAKECTIYFIEEVLGYEPTSQEFKEFMRELDASKFFKEYKLATLFRLFNSSKHQLLLNAYGNIYAVWEVQNAVPKGYWDNLENRANAVKWLFEYKNGIDIESLSQQGIVRIPKKLIKDGCLDGIVTKRFSSVKKLLQEVYPKANIDNIIITDKHTHIKFDSMLEVYKKIITKEYEAHSSFWDNKEVRKICINYFVEDILKIKDISKEAYKISIKAMRENGLDSLLDRYEWDRYKILKEVYPELEEWEIGSRKGKWDNRENRKKAVKAVLGDDIEALKCKTVEEIKEMLDNKGSIGLVAYYGGLPGLFIDIYDIKPWQFRVPNGYWDSIENVNCAIKWLIDEKLNGNYEVLRNKGVNKLTDYLKDYGLSCMVIKNKLNGDKMIELYKENASRLLER